MTLKPPYRQAPTLTTPTFKDEMKANGKPSDTPPPENEDIAKLLRALNEDLRADPQDDDVEYEEEEPAARSRLPLGKIAMALVAAGGIAVGVVYFGSGDPAPVTTAANSGAPMVPAPAITRAPANQTPANPAPGAASNATGSLPTPATTPTPTTSPTAATQAPPVQSAPAQTPAAAPPPPVAALPTSPPPVLKVPEPPSVPATAPAAAPKPRAAAPMESAPAVQKPESPKPEAAKPEAPKQDAPADTGSLQAMLAPPKEPAKRPPAATPAAPATPPAASPGNGEPKQAAKAAAPPTPAAQAPAGRYTVQVGSFSVTGNADSLVQRLQGNGFQAYTVDWTDGSNRSWRAVRVGGYPDPAAAKREAEQLKSKMGLNPVVVSTR
ncbi:SPOR domain-containing protein [Azospirillum sp. TSH64]|uniref:SPOR domain-containing protein n=1 Tax=Azospirillum sp. TSH64 TaxID=652740 RepID=UPI0020001994|nr:SPOR domain-containing protein [Azospirillum sp. TSH64]